MKIRCTRRDCNMSFRVGEPGNRGHVDYERCSMCNLPMWDTSAGGRNVEDGTPLAIVGILPRNIERWFSSGHAVEVEE